MLAPEPGDLRAAARASDAIPSRAESAFGAVSESVLIWRVAIPSYSQ
jgi:hypothetical protein